VSTEINTFCLARSIGQPSKKVFDSNMRTHIAEKSTNLAGVIKEKENNKYENQIEALWEVHTFKWELLEGWSLEQTQRHAVDRT